MMRRSLPLVFLVTLGFPSISAAQVSGFVSFGVGIQAPATDAFTQSGNAPFRSETAVFEANYRNLKAGTAFDVGGGVFFTPTFGVGLAFSHFSSQHDGTMFVSLPNPAVFNRPATDTVDTETLDHSESAVHINAVFAPQFKSKATLLLFAGPSRVSIKKRLVEDVDIAEAFINVSPFPYAIAISDLQYADESPSAWGFNVGATIGYAVHRNVSVGGTIRYTKATLDLKDAVQSTLTDSPKTQNYDAGGPSVTFGITARFGK